MEEKIIKWSSKKIVLSLILYLLELALLLWILSFLLSYPEEAPAGLVAFILFIGFLILIVGFIWYQRLRRLFSDTKYGSSFHKLLHIHHAVCCSYPKMNQTCATNI